ncbi:MAG: C39 family peptidase, partial [Solobacterium sp.]|nr:C39 family peptidase [Solobacterium sp.]
DNTETTIAETEEAIEKPTIDEPIQEETITEKKTAQKVLLDVPQAVQENGYYCGPAILQMTLLWHGIDSNQDDLALKLNTSAITGTEYADMARALNSYLFGYDIPSTNEAGYRVQELTHGYISEEDMQLLCKRTMIDIDNGDPLPLAINLSSLYPEQPIANHFVLIVGYRTNEHGELTDFYIRDPYGKVQDATYQGLKIFTVSEIQEALKWNDEPAYIW